MTHVQGGKRSAVINDTQPGPDTTYSSRKIDALIDGGYFLPADGIPKSDLSQGVQGLLAKAESALQEGDIPTKVSAFENDSDYATAAQVEAARDEAIQAAADNTDEKIAETILAGNNTFTGENIFEGDLFLLKDGVYHNVGEQIAQLFNQMPTVIEVPYGSELDLTPDVLENYAWFEVVGRHRMAFSQHGVQYPDSPKIFNYAKFTVQYNKWENRYGALFLYGIENNGFQNMTNAPSVNMGVTITPLGSDSYDIDEPRPVLVCLHGGMPIGSSS